MNINNFLTPRLMAGAAFVGLVGAAGVFIYEQVYAEKRRSMLVREVQRLDLQMATMRQELETLRELQKETHLRRMKQKNLKKRQKKPTPAGDVDTVDAQQSYASDSEYFTDYQSVLGTDGEMDSEEFYDVHTDEDDDTLRETANGHVGILDLDDDVVTSSPKLSPKSSPKLSPKSSPRNET